MVDMSRDPERVWPTWCNTLTITPACVEDCFTLDVFKDVDLSFLTKESIAGRSKRDYFTKFITSIQAFWFCVQFFVRIHESLPVSLLELNTFAHSVCALITYCLWWHKPSDIDDPFVLYTEHSSALRDLCAAQWTLGASGKHYKKQCISRSSSSSSSSTDDEKVTLSSKWIPSFTHAGSELPMNFFRGRSGITLLPGTGEDWYIFRPNEPRWHYYPRYRDEKRLKLRIISESHHSDYPTTATTLLQSGQRIPGTNEHVDHRFRLVEVDSITLHRWHRALSSHPSSSSAFFRGNYSIWLRDRQPNFVWPRGLDSTDGPAIADELVKSLFTALITSLSYGSLHILAWDSAVLHPNSAEEMLWKISCLNLEVLGPFAFIVWAGLKGWRGPDAHLNLSLGWSVAMGIVTSAAFLAYVLSRVYLVVEAFVVIPYMDPGVYEMPKYAVYFPHVG